MRPTLIATAGARCTIGAHTGAHQRFELAKHKIGEAQLLGNRQQHSALCVIHGAVGKRCLNLDFQKHPIQVSATTCFLAKLRQHPIQIKFVLLTFIKEVDRSAAHFGRQLHVVHHRLGMTDFITRDVPISLGDMAHDGEGRGKESQLNPLLIIGAAGVIRV